MPESKDTKAKTGKMSRGFRPKLGASSPKKRPLLKEQINLEHPLVKLSQAIEWQGLEQEFGKQTSSEGGRPTLPTRLMVGLHYLKALYDESDESVVAKWVENPYWQYFCGEETFQHELPCHPSSLVKWRQTVGVEGIEKMLKQVLDSASQQKALKPREIERVRALRDTSSRNSSDFVNVDTTVQEKAIAFATDARLYDKARRALVRVARKYQLKLRQSYVRLGKQALFFQSRYAAARQGKRAKQQTRKLRTYLGRVIRDIKPKQAFVDKGFRGTAHHPQGVEVFVCGTRKLTGVLKGWLKRRSAIEPVIGHSKQDHALKRNYLPGKTGDRINAFLAGCGFNLRKLFRFFLTNPLIQVRANT